MAFSGKSLKQVIVDGIDVIIEEGNNNSVNFRKVYWEDTEKPKDNPNPKYEIRKYTIDKEGNEVPSKGVTFISEDAPRLLINSLIEAGYGDTGEILQAITRREDFPEAVQALKLEDGYKFDVNLLEAIKVE